MLHLYHDAPLPYLEAGLNLHLAYTHIIAGNTYITAWKQSTRKPVFGQIITIYIVDVVGVLKSPPFQGGGDHLWSGVVAVAFDPRQSRRNRRHTTPTPPR